MSPSASILIVNFNSGQHLEACLESLVGQTHENFEVIVLDNASNDDSMEKAQRIVANDARFQLVPENHNFGFAEGNNRAAGQAQADLIITLNPDAFPEPDWLETLLDAAHRYPDVAMFGSTQIDAAQPGKIDGAGDRYFAGGIPWREQNNSRLGAHAETGQSVYETFAPCAAAALYRTKAFRAVGGFDRRFFCFVEDVDLGYRLRRRNASCLQVIDARVRHVGGGAGGGRSDFARYYGTRNLIWCFFKNTPGALMPVLLPAHLLLLTVLALKTLLRGDPGPTLRGIRDGLAGISSARDIAHRGEMAPGGLLNVISAMDWSPLAYLRRN